MLAAARLTLKHHRVEVGAVVIASIVLAAAGQWLNSTLLGFNVPQGCFDQWVQTEGEPAANCIAPVGAFAGFLFDNTSWFDPAMFILPFAAGTLAGVPIVARELESRTAQTAWYLSPSRSAWLVRQLWPVILLVGAAVALAAASASMLHNTRINAFPPSFFEGLGLHGPLVAARALLAFGVALLAGALVGRSLPAWIVAAIACTAFVAFSASARHSWLGLQESVILEQTETGSFVLLEQLYRAPDGTLLSEEEALALVPPENVGSPYEWLADSGYVGVYRGITENKTRDWEPLEIVGTILVGTALVGATFAIVERRRPT